MDHYYYVTKGDLAGAAAGGAAVWFLLSKSPLWIVAGIAAGVVAARLTGIMPDIILSSNQNG